MEERDTGVVEADRCVVFESDSRVAFGDDTAVALDDAGVAV